MSIFDGKRLDNNTFKLDADRMRKGWYTDKYFSNIAEMLTILSKSGYCYKGNSPRLKNIRPDRRYQLRRPGSGDAGIYPAKGHNNFGGTG